MISNETVKEIKNNFPILRNNLIYLDNASTTQKPKEVIEKIKEYYENYNANIHRGIYTISVKATEEYENAKKAIAKFINSEQEEIIFTRGTTESLNILSYTLQEIIPKEKNEILLTEIEHHSNLVPWQEYAKRNNMKLKFIELKPDFTLDLEDAKQKITEKTAILSLNHISNTLGTINPIKEIIKIAKGKNVITIVDAAQSIGHKKIDVKEIGCDFLAFSGHKMLGPTGIGVLYGKRRLLEKLPPFQFGGDMIESVGYESSIYNKIPEKFEAGTQNIAGAIGLNTAIEYINKIGLENIEKWEIQLKEYFLEKLKDIKDIKIYSPKVGSGIVSFNIGNIHPHDLSSLLDDYNIAIRGGHHCTMPLMKKLGITGTSRVSFYIYNSFEDVDRLIEALKEIQKRFI